MYISLPETADVNIWLRRYIRSTGSTSRLLAPARFMSSRCCQVTAP